MAGPPDAAYSNLSDAHPGRRAGMPLPLRSARGRAGRFRVLAAHEDRFRSGGGRRARRAARDTRHERRLGRDDDQQRSRREQRFRRSRPTSAMRAAALAPGRDVHVQPPRPAYGHRTAHAPRRSSTRRKDRTGSRFESKALPRRRRRHLRTAAVDAQLRRPVVERPRIGIGLGPEPRAPGRRDLRDLVHLRCAAARRCGSR